MAVSLDAIDRAFSSLSPRLAVFDRPIRERVGQWTVQEPVETDAIISRFASHGGFTQDGKIVIPLHEEETPDLTGEYLVYLPDHIIQCLVYFDFGGDQARRIPLDEFGTTYPARRVRFWHPDRDPDPLPDYLEAPAGNEATRTEILGSREQHVTFDSVVDDLRGFLNREREAERDEARRQFQSLRPQQYTSVAGGIPTVTNGGFDVDEYGQQYLRLRVPQRDDNTSIDISADYDIYPGMEVLIGTKTETRAFPIEAEVLDIVGRDLHLGIYWNRLSPSPPETAFDLEEGLDEFSVGELLNPVPYDRQEDAVEVLEEAAAKRGVLTGETTLSFESSVDVPLREHRLNKDQYQAAMNALQAQQVYCIHGPPGTGKTRVLVEIVRALAAEGQRVLICAHSNQAVDNVLVGDSTAEYGDRSSLHPFIRDGEFTAARAGQNTASDLVEAEYVGNDLYRSDVVCATTSGAAQFGRNIFDYALLDEATQATIPASVIPMTRAERLVLAGDHKQLPPYHSQEEHEQEQFEPSLFEHILSTYGEDSFTMLKTQYRMNEEIARFPDKEFYGGMLSHGPKNRTWTIAGLPPLKTYDVDGTEQETPSSSYYNDAEIQVVVSEVGDLLAAGIAPEEIGIITPYSGQLGKLTGALLEQYDRDQVDEIKIDTIDSFQGGERDVIIISFVRSNPSGTTGFLTFPTEGPRRLNVALTRARKRCVLIGDFDTLRSSGEHAEDASPVFERLYKSLKDRDCLEHVEPKANEL